MIGLGLTRQALEGEWWRLWTCHAAHWDAGHAALNAVTVVPPLLLLGWRRSVRNLLPWMLAAAPLISAALLATGYDHEYRGASGVVAGSWAFAAVALWRGRERSAACILGGFLMLKLGFELFGILPSHSTAFETVSLVHYAGVVLGAAAGAWSTGTPVRLAGDPKAGPRITTAEEIG